MRSLTDTVLKLIKPERIREIRDLEIAEHPDVKAEKRHKETIKWAKIAIVVGITVSIVAIIFN